MGSSRSITIVVTGLRRDQAARRLLALAMTGAVVLPMTDIEGALAVRDGRADYFIGICQSGAGGALAMAVAFLGRERCATLAAMGRPASASEVARALEEGRVAFGISSDQVEATSRLLMAAILSRA